jgi:signal transduction histidine kinase/GAF domain-containing protein
MAVDLIHSSYRRIGEALVGEIEELLHQGEHVALLGSREGGKSLVLSELEYRVCSWPERKRPKLIYLDGRNQDLATVEGFIRTIASRLESPHCGTVPQGTRISGIVFDLVRDALRRDHRPLWLFVRDLLDLPVSLVRGLLEALQTLHEDIDIGRRVGAAITGGIDFVPLTYGGVSPFRHALKFLLTGFEIRHAGLFFARRRICQRGGGKVAERAGFEEVDAAKEIEEDALKFLYDQTAGNGHLIQQIVVRIPGYPRPPRIEQIEGRWTLPETKVFVEHFLHAHMPDDFHVRMAVRDVKRDPPAFELLTTILAKGDGKVRIGDPRPHTVELAGLAYRDSQGFASIASPLWHAYLNSSLSACHVADTYACQRLWGKAWPAYVPVSDASRNRPLTGDAADRLREVLVDWEDSFVDRISAGPEAVCKQFFQGARFLLGCDAGGVYDYSKSPPSLLDADRDVLQEGDPYVPDPADRPCAASASTKFWLDPERYRLFSNPETPLSSPFRVQPVLCLERFNLDRPMDEAEQKYIAQILDRFWNAYFRAQEIQYAKGIGGLRERHLRVIERVNAMLVEDAFEMGRVVKKTAEALVNDAGYLRIQISLVDAKGEYIQAIAGSCAESSKLFDYPSNFPLHSEKPIEKWDIEPWVVKMGEICVVEDAASSSRRNPTTQWEDAERLGMKAITVVPIKIGSRVLGTIHFERHDKAAPSREEQELFRIFASQLAVVFEHGQRFALLQESVHQLPDKVRVLDPAGRPVFLNRPAVAGDAALTAGWQSPAANRSKMVGEKGDRLWEQVERSGAPGRLYHFNQEGASRSAFERLIAPVEDFRSKLPPPYGPAHGRIGYVERIHDVTELYDLYESLQAWLRERGLRNTAAKVLQFFRAKGHQWCRLYLCQTEPTGADVLVSFQEFGLKIPENQVNFRGGKIYFARNGETPQPWHTIDVARGPAIYDLDPTINDFVVPTEDWNGFPRYLARSVPYEHELERGHVVRWIEAPLRVGSETIGKFSLSVPDDLRAEEWELLRSTILGIAVALHNARRLETEANRVAEETWQMAAAQAVHQLGNKLGPTVSWLRYALADLEADPAKVPADIGRANRGIESALAILDDFRRYASEKPFEDTRRYETTALLRQVLDRISERHPGIRLDLTLPVAEAAVAVSFEAMLEVFEILVDNSVRHSQLDSSRLQIRVSAEAVSDNGSRVLGGVPAVCISCSDNGVGIPKPERGQVFEPFRSTHQEGTGLGLTIARRYVRRHRGELVVSDTSKSGACFLIYLPTVK